MQCSKCKTEFDGNFCPNCGTPAAQNVKQGGVLFGFRSNKRWRKTLSFLYLVVLGLSLLISIFVGVKGQMSTFDFLLDKASSVFLLLIFFSPYIFLSDTKLRHTLPLFKQKRAGASVCGMLIVIVAMFIVYGAFNSMHSPEYKNDMASHAFAVVSEEDATCTQPGQKSLKCDYCGRQEEEAIDPLGHDMQEVSRTEPTIKTAGLIEYKCSRCGATESIELEQLPHTHIFGDWTIEAEAGCETNGIKSRVCECGEIETEEIPYKGHSFGSWILTREATCADVGSQERFCDCGEKETSVIQKTDAHLWGEWVIDTAASVETTGLMHRICSVCQTQDLEMIKKISPISITSQTYTIDSVGGVEWKTEIRNNSTETIKYIILKWTCYNAVNDVIYDQIDGKSYVKIRCTGPFEGQTTKTYRNTTKFYNHTYDHSVFNEITVEFMDGRIITITDTEYTDILKRSGIDLPSFPIDVYSPSGKKYCTITSLKAEICDIDDGGVRNDILIKKFHGSYANLEGGRRNAKMNLIDSAGNIVHSWTIESFDIRYYAYNCIEAGETYTIEFVFD